jgi:DNA helicase-2/ATP-dependent DNA helicase PcrA
MIFSKITKTLSTPEIIENMLEDTTLSQSRRAALEKFLKLYRDLYNKMTTMKPVDFIRFLINAIEIEEEVKKSADTEKIAQIRLENINAFINAVASEFDSNKDNSNIGFFIDFINSVSLVQSGDEKDKDQGLNIITAHSAKGLEFDTVFLVGFYNGGIPHSMAIKEGNIEEERRLCYVAFTRAKKRLIITIPTVVRKQGKIMPVEKSIFFTEAGLHLLNKNSKRMTTKEKIDKIQKFIDRMRK